MTSKTLRFGIIGLYHESNTFIPESTTFDHYRKSLFLVGEEVRLAYGNAHHEISGFFQTLADAEIEAVPIMFANASHWGKVTDETLDTLWRVIQEGLDAAGLWLGSWRRRTALGLQRADRIWTVGG